MDKDEIYKSIQKICNDTSPVIVLGSGASASYEIASMVELAKHLEEIFSQKKYENSDSTDCVGSFLEKIRTGVGLEETLSEVRVTEEVENDIIISVWNKIVEQDRNLFYDFVEGKRTIELTDLFNHLIYGRYNATINVVTTNYDRIAEYAASKTNAFINTGFSQSYCGDIKSKLDAYPNKLKVSYVGRINIWKAHGSVDWFSRQNITYCLPGVNKIPEGYMPCIITPGSTKYEKTTQEPHREFLAKIDAVFRDASGFVCVGYGFNDNHIHPKLLSAAKAKTLPILIVTKEITDSIKGKVMTGDYDYTVVYSDEGNGTIIKTSNNEIAIPDEEIWKLDNFCKIIL